MKNRKSFFCALGAAIIWGTAFVAQDVCVGYVSPFTFNAIRSVIAVAVLSLTVFLFRRFSKHKTNWNKEYRRQLLLGGLCCGVLLTISANLQQFGINAGAEAGKAGFITALYIVLVPLLGIAFRRRATLTVWISVVIAVAGLYLLCVEPGKPLRLATSDVYLLLCALMFATHILCVDHFVQKVDGLELSWAQFCFVAVFSAILALLTESTDFSWARISQRIWPILYVGVFSSGIAYSLQILAQKGSNPTVTSILLSMESLFATVAGAILLHEVLKPWEYVGCALMLCAIVLTQLPAPKKKRKAD